MSISAICTVAGAVVGALTLLGNIILFKKTYEQTERINHSNSMAKYYNVIFLSLIHISEPTRPY